MAQYFSREMIFERLKQQTEKGKSFLLFGAGNGLSAKSAEKGGADIIAIYSTAVFRMKGLPSLICACPYGDANEEMFRAAEEILPLIKKTPCIAGVGAHNPLCPVDRLLDRVVDMGFCGVTNEPFVGIYGSWFAQLCEESGIGFSCEAELIKKAHQRDLFTVAWVFDETEARIMAEAGADVIGAMVVDGPVGMEPPGYTEEQRLLEAIEKVERMYKAAKQVRPEVLVLLHGDPFNDVENVRRSVRLTGVEGYASGSSGERLPAQKGIEEQTKIFRDILLREEEI